MVKLFPWEWSKTTPNHKLLSELKNIQKYFSVVRVKAEAEPGFFTYYYKIILIPLSEKEAPDQDSLDFMAEAAAITVQTAIQRWDEYKGVNIWVKLR